MTTPPTWCIKISILISGSTSLWKHLFNSVCCYGLFFLKSDKIILVPHLSYNPKIEWMFYKAEGWSSSNDELFQSSIVGNLRNWVKRWSTHTWWSPPGSSDIVVNRGQCRHSVCVKTHMMFKKLKKTNISIRLTWMITESMRLHLTETCKQVKCLHWINTFYNQTCCCTIWCSQLNTTSKRFNDLNGNKRTTLLNSPVCERVCIFRFSRREKLLLQVGQWCGFSLVCVRIWINILYLWKITNQTRSD